MKLTIDRKRWARGPNTAGNRLLCGENGRMCCLGFLSLALGYSEDQIRNRAMPAELAGPSPPVFAAVDDNGCHFVRDAACFNDSPAFKEPAREAALTRLFAEHGGGVKKIPTLFERGPVGLDFVRFARTHQERVVRWELDQTKPSRLHRILTN